MATIPNEKDFSGTGGALSTPTTRKHLSVRSVVPANLLVTTGENSGKPLETRMIEKCSIPIEHLGV
jgi:hypothetical protein